MTRRLCLWLVLASLILPVPAFDQDFDVPAIATFVLGRYARTISPQDKQKFESVFEDVVVYTWSRRFSEYNGQTIKVSSTVADGQDGSIVKSTINGKGGE